MKVLVLAAGYGTRLYPIIKDTAKALLAINGKPLINYILDRIRNLNGLNEVIVVTNNKFYNQFVDWSKKLEVPYKVTIVNDKTDTPETRLGSIGDIHFTLDNYPIKDDLLVVGGDNLFDYNVEEYVLFAQKKNAAAIGLYDIGNLEEAKLFGVVAIDADRKVTLFEEKPAQPKSTLIAMCFYYLPAHLLGSVAQYLHECKTADKAGDYIKWLYKQTDVFGFKFTGTWYDIGSVESYYEAQKRFGVTK
ncbi:MAG: nucleotidyltransferase family protein [Candidatus Omnitrophica bacterium]|nr:nucleotidyltransferase family protein [Candidatus Omnitrophota bacterium]